MSAKELEMLRVAAQTAAGEILRVSASPGCTDIALVAAANMYRRCLTRYHEALSPGATEGTVASRLSIALEAPT